MGAEETRRWTCSGCGTERSPEVASANPRPPCPECGETANQTTVGIEAESVGISDHVEVALIPEEQERTWERRWQDAQDHLTRLLTPRSEPLSADAIHAAHADLQAYYVQTYHLKDSLIDASATTGISRRTIENEITNNPDLALLADLANLDKHGHLSNPPRSGHVPRIVRLDGSASSSGTTAGGWTLDVVIDHRGQQLDGLDVPKRANAAWELVLRRWKLL